MRAQSQKRGYNYRWKKLRIKYLRANPLSECKRCDVFKCQDRGKTIAANTVHHIKPIKTHPELRLSWSNLMAVSRECHERIEGRHK